MRFKRILIALLAVAAFVPMASAQNAGSETDGSLTVQALFKYPVAPDFMESIDDRSDYLVENFWNPMDFKQKTVDQTALVHAFGVYVAPMSWASKARTLNSVDKLLDNLKKNPTLLLQFVKAAEENLHGERAEVYIDEVYVKFLEALRDNKKIKPERKKKYLDQLAAMEACKTGNKLPATEVKDSTGNAVDMKMGDVATIMLFGSPSRSVMREAMLRVASSVPMQKLIKSGALALQVNVTTAPGEESDEFLTGLTPGVQGGYLTNAGDFDLRLNPDVYLLGPDGSILLKNVNFETAVVGFETIMKAITNPDNSEK